MGKERWKRKSKKWGIEANVCEREREDLDRTTMNRRQQDRKGEKYQRKGNRIRRKIQWDNTTQEREREREREKKENTHTQTQRER